MRRTRLGGDGYWILGALLLLIAAVSTAVISSCGGGGGSSNGGLCEQCGNSPDGPCQPSVLVVPGPDQPAPCNTSATPDPAATPHCEVRLHCFRKLGSAQRRCFAEDDEQFRCDGERANRSTPGPTATPTVTSTPTCGNGTAEGNEQCDRNDLNEETCASRCTDGAGTLACKTTDCTFDFSGCTAGLNCR